MTAADGNIVPAEDYREYTDEQLELARLNDDRDEEVREAVRRARAQTVKDVLSGF